MLTSKEIRRKFLQYFESKGHEIVPSAPVVNKNDPTLMFINAGMNPFKDFFLGNATPKNARIADTQKCLRVSGKHNDLDEVGHDTYHHTLFEMLGNWSIGDYFKKEAIEWAWDLLTNVYGLDKDRLYVTVFEGDAKDGLPRDNEAADLWAQFVPAERILNGNKADNFWEMGETGPCGPCSEIHVDLRSEEERAKVSGASLVNKDHPQVVEIWNLVFMQFNRKASGELENLPAQHIDTGMGFERLCMALQGKQSNYDTDVFTPLIDKVAGISGIKYGAEEATDIAQRVIADHIRAVAFAIADGQLPASSGAGYVIRRILRRAIRYGFSYLNLKSPFMFQLVETLESEMGEFFPELTAQQALVEKVIEEEEQSFLKTLAQGLAKLEEFLATDAKVLDGKRAFELYDTYGFPIDLTELIMRENDRTVDMAGFTEEMTAQKERSRAATKLSTDDWVELEEDDKEEFIGYDYTEADVRITRYRKVSAKKKEFYQLVLSMTPFYAEGGGQVGDTGTLTQGERTIAITNTKKENGIIVHFTDTLPEDLSGTWQAQVNTSDRNETAKNHSATHLM
ncbi:MAG: alanine--tRNA ligase, partial [Bacteroidetes bacterium]